MASAAPAAKSKKSIKSRRAPVTPKAARHTGADVDIAHGARLSVAAPSGRVERSAKAETVVGSSEAAAPATRNAGPTSPFEIALQTVRDEVAARSPRAAGRISVSFAVGARGRVGNIMVIGFDRTLDAHLEGVLAKQVFPARYAGQRFNTTLTVRAAAPKKVRAPKKIRASAKRARHTPRRRSPR